MKDNRWSKRIRDWCPYNDTRWRDDKEKFAGKT